MRKSYPSDVSREQFSEIEPLLLSARKITAPRKLDLYDVFCAVLYILKSGCQWRMLPSDFPKWRSVHAYFQIWSERIDSELHKFVVIPKGWVVERSFSWLEKCRRLWKNCERKMNTSLQMVALAFIGLLPNNLSLTH
jgi:transposase